MAIIEGYIGTKRVHMSMVSTKLVAGVCDYLQRSGVRLVVITLVYVP